MRSSNNIHEVRLPNVSDSGGFQERQRQAVELLKSGRFGEAAAILADLVKLHPNEPDAHLNYGVVLAKQQKLAAAERSFRTAASLRSEWADAESNLGLVLLELQKHNDAIWHLRRAARLNPNVAKNHLDLGRALLKVKNWEDAEIELAAGYLLEPTLLEVCCRYLDLLVRRKNWKRVADMRHSLLRLSPKSPKEWIMLGKTFHLIGEFESARNCFERVGEETVGRIEALMQLGVLAGDEGNYETAIDLLKQALQLNPDDSSVKLNLAMLQLLTEDFQEGWSGYEARKNGHTKIDAMVREKEWTGEDLCGRTLVLYNEQGMGDMLQFVRYIPQLRAKGAKVVLMCPPVLAPLLSQSLTIDQIVTDKRNMPNFDFSCSLLSLPVVLKTDLSNIPRNVPYLSADPDLVGKWQHYFASLPGFKIGIAWQGNPEHIRDFARSFPLQLFRSLVQVGGIVLFSMQKGHGSEQLMENFGTFPVMDLGGITDLNTQPMQDTAAIVQCLDLIVTVDSFLAHLAGALGAPVWVPLPTNPDWRWLLARDDSPWYPTMRLFRQNHRGNWEDVFNNMAAVLRHEVLQGAC